MHKTTVTNTGVHVSDSKDTTDFLSLMDDRSRQVFRCVVQNYLETGNPVGSRTLTRSLNEKISSATVRNVMQDLEHLGLLDSPHISAGRLPTELGLRIFIDGLLEIDDLPQNTRDKLDSVQSLHEEYQPGSGVKSLITKVGDVLSEVTQGASLVLVPKHEAPIEHVELVNLTMQRMMIVLVFADGHIENRIFSVPKGQTYHSLRDAVDSVNTFVQGMTLTELRKKINDSINTQREEIAEHSKLLVESGLAVYLESTDSDERLLVRGRSHLLGDAYQSQELERIKQLFDDLEHKRDIIKFLELAETGKGVRIFIGSENKLFSLSASSMVVAPYMNDKYKIVGAVGVIGPTRLNYGKIVPIVHYTARVLSHIISDCEQI